MVTVLQMYHDKFAYSTSITNFVLLTYILERIDL